MPILPRDKFNRLKRLLDEEQKKGKKTNWLTLEANQSLNVRILPIEQGPDGGEKTWFWAVGQHYIANTYVDCPKLCEDKPCPLCEKAEALYTEARSCSKSDPKLAEQLRKRAGLYNAKKRWLIVVIDRKDEAMVPKLFRAPKDIWLTVFKDYMANAEDCDILDLWEGFDYTFTRDGDGIDSKYSATRKAVSTPLSKLAREQAEAKVERIMSEVPDLSEYINPPTYEELEKLLNNGHDALQRSAAPQSSARRQFAVEEAEPAEPAEPSKPPEPEDNLPEPSSHIPTAGVVSLKQRVEAALKAQKNKP